MTTRAEELIKYVMANSELNREQAIEWMDKNLMKGWRER